MGRFRFIAGWLLATAIAMALAFGAVSIVAGDISEGPRELASASTPASTVDPVGPTTTTIDGDPSPTSTLQGPSSSTTTPSDDDSATTAPSSSSTTEASSPSTTEPDDDDSPSSSSTSSPTSTSPSSSTSSSSPAPSSTSSSSPSSSTTTSPSLSVIVQTESYDGNWVRFSCAANIAGVQTFAVGNGYRLAEAPQLSGGDAKVEFESVDGVVEVDFRAKCEAGRIETWSEVD